MLIELIRLVVTLGCTAAGFVVGRQVPVWSGSGAVDADVAIVLGSTIGAGIGYVAGGLLGRGIRRGLDRAPQLVARASGPQLFAGTFGMVVDSSLRILSMFSAIVRKMVAVSTGWSAQTS